MAKIVPSDIVRYIDKVIINAAVIQKNRSKLQLHRPDHLDFLQSLLDLLDKIDDFLFWLGTDDYICFIAAKAAISSRIVEWQTRSDRTLDTTSGFRMENPVILIRGLLEKCPDRLIPAKVAGLKFIEDKECRELLRIDLASVEFLFNNNEWKAIMVIAGSAIETILYEKIKHIKKNDANKFNAALKAALSSKELKKTPPATITRWNLNQYIIVAKELRLISEDTKKQTLLGKDFRNLIHPGLAIRKKVSCDRGTAHGVLAALDRVIADIKGS